MHAVAEGRSFQDVPESVGREFAESDPGGKLPERVGKGRDTKARDMSPENWKVLRWLLNKFFAEESIEAEHEESGEEGRDNYAEFLEREQPGLYPRTVDNQVPVSTTANAGAPMARRRSETDDALSSKGALKAAHKLRKRGLDESEETKKHNQGELSESTREEIGHAGSSEREDMPESVFLKPGERKYPVKEKRDGKWEYTRNLLLAAARRARMNGEEELASRADAIREREFGSKEESEHQGAHDALAMDFKSKRVFDSDGRMMVEDSVISRAVVSPYNGSEIPDFQQFGLDGGKRYMLYRDPKEIKRALDSFRMLPILDKHVPVSADKPRMEDAIGCTGTDVNFDGKNLRSSLKFWTQDAIDDITSGRRKALSCAYRYKPVMQPGVAEDGSHFDGRMEGLEANHLALVPEGRVPGALVADGVNGLLDFQWAAIEQAILRLAGR